MGKVYSLLAINDTSSPQTRMFARPGSDDTFALDIDYGPDELRGRLKGLIGSGLTFRNCIFTTHGNKGMIFFAHQVIDREYMYREFYTYDYTRLFPFADTKVYFGGCNVAESEAGWRFLAAAARSLLRRAGGTAIGWTSAGFDAGWLTSHHQIHFWGDTRQVMVLPGGDYLRFYENWNMIKDSNGDPGSPV